MIELQILMNNISKWSDSVSGSDERRAGMLAHLKKEIEELKTELFLDKQGGNNELGIQVELADCLMLLLDIANHSKVNAESLLFEVEHKLGINKLRKWGKPDKDGSVQHIKYD